MKPGLYMGAEARSYTPEGGHERMAEMNKPVVVRVEEDEESKIITCHEWAHVAAGTYVLWPAKWLGHLITNLQGLEQRLDILPAEDTGVE